MRTQCRNLALAISVVVAAAGAVSGCSSSSGSQVGATPDGDPGSGNVGPGPGLMRGPLPSSGSAGATGAAGAGAGGGGAQGGGGSPGGQGGQVFPPAGGSPGAGGRGGAAGFPVVTVDAGSTPDVGGGVDGSAMVDAAAPLGTFVSGAIGNDMNPGTRTAPVRTIGRAMQIAASLLATGATQSVMVAQGHYPEKIRMVEGISLLGGHDCADAAACSWARNTAMIDSAIDNVDDEGVVAAVGVTRRTRFDGFRVRGRSGGAQAPQGIACLTLNGGAPTIANNNFAGGQVGGNSGRAVGIEIYAVPGGDPAGALITDNTIQVAFANNNTIGIALEGRPGVPPGAGVAATIVSNIIRGGGAQIWSGIVAWASAAGTLVKGNDITSGSSTAFGSWAIQVQSKMTIDANRINVDQNALGSCTGNNWCGGINSISGTVLITNNVVFGGKGQRSAALMLSEMETPAGTAVVNGNLFDGGGAAATGGASMSAAIAMRIGSCATCGLRGIVGRIRNNILLGGAGQSRFGVYEDMTPQKTIHPEVLDNNDFFFPARAGSNDALYHLWDGSNGSSLTTLAQLAAVPASSPPANDLNVDPLIDATFHLSKMSPVIDKGSGVEAPPRDIDNEARPRGATIDIGPDEAN